MTGELAAFGQVVLIDLVLAGDNAVVIGALAANLPVAQRRIAVIVGTSVAVVARILLSLATVWLLLIPGVMLIGGTLLLWVAWKMWKGLQEVEAEADPANENQPVSVPVHQLRYAAIAIVLADISMSLDNVLGVAGAAVGHTWALVFGLTLSVLLMGAAASVIATVINKHRWIGYVGLALILFVAGRMVWHGIDDLQRFMILPAT